MDKLLTNNINAAHTIVQKALLQKRFELLEPESKELIEIFGIPTTRRTVATSPADAVKAATAIGYPVVLKIVSPDISHKTDVGGVKVGINSDEGVRVAYEKIMENVKTRLPDARTHGILVEEMAKASTEIIVGGLRDPQFGPAVMFGLGGIFVEVFKDVSFRIAPIEEHEALDMINEVKGSKILKGFRNTEALDISTLAQTIMHVSDMMVSIEEIKEIDLNPVIVYPQGVKSVDARIIIRRL